MDANGDGELSEDELEGRLKEDFDELDSDGSGTLTSDEVSSGPPSRN